MKIEERTIGPVVVLDMAGRLVAGESQGHLKDKINSLTMQGRLQILLNLTAKVQDLLAICRLSTVFETIESEAEALSSFTVGVV